MVWNSIIPAQYAHLIQFNVETFHKHTFLLIKGKEGQQHRVSDLCKEQYAQLYYQMPFHTLLRVIAASRNLMTHFEDNVKENANMIGPTPFNHSNSISNTRTDCNNSVVATTSQSTETNNNTSLHGEESVSEFETKYKVLHSFKIKEENMEAILNESL